jgi:hypothetical protein
MNETLKRAVIRQIGNKESLRDVMNHGAAGGYPGFTYYVDTIAFYRRQKANIIQLAEELAADLGVDVLRMVAEFNCLRNDYTQSEVAKVMYGPWKDDDAHVMIANALAWFAAEEVARDIYDR